MLSSGVESDLQHFPPTLATRSRLLGFALGISRRMVLAAESCQFQSEGLSSYTSRAMSFGLNEKVVHAILISIYNHRLFYKESKGCIFTKSRVTPSMPEIGIFFNPLIVTFN